MWFAVCVLLFVCLCLLFVCNMLFVCCSFVVGCLWLVVCLGLMYVWRGSCVVARVSLLHYCYCQVCLCVVFVASDECVC